MDTMFYFYYLFYKKIMKDDSPHIFSCLGISACETFFVVNIVSCLLIQFCIKLGFWGSITIGVLITLLNVYYFIKSGRYKNIEKSKPMYFGNKWISIVTAIVFFIITVSSMFWGPIYLKHHIDMYCK